MRKLKLVLEDLEVQSLVTDSTTGPWGTVIGRVQALPTVVETCDTDPVSPTETCPNEVASFDSPCPSTDVFRFPCDNYTGVLICYNTEAEFCH